FPGTRSITVTPTRIRTGTPALGGARVVRSTSAGWSPGDAVRDGLAVSTTSAAVPGASAIRLGRTPSHEATRRADRPPATGGRPRGRGVNPAADAETTIGGAPGFATRITRRSRPASVT